MDRDGLNIQGMAVGFGVAWAICILLVSLASNFGWATQFVEILSSVYIGLKPTFTGAIIGALWGFVNGAIFGLIMALIYNMTIKTSFSIKKSHINRHGSRP